MPRIIINTDNVHKDEVELLKASLEADCWSINEITQIEINGIISLINYIINERKGEKASALNYLDLLELKNKLQK